MSTAVVIPCGCCKALTEADTAVFDTELKAHVCRECRPHLVVAKAECSRSWSAPSGGVPSMQINIRGVYHGEDAGDNQAASIPPPSDL